jgi:lysophospholipid acyltransferase (LPLAT)-like uncharacterized protein
VSELIDYPKLGDSDLPLNSNPNPDPGKDRTRPRRVSGLVIPHEPRWWQNLLGWMIYTAIRLVTLTIRFRVHREHPGPNPGQVIYCVWHNRLALIMPVYRRFCQPKTSSPGVAVMVSASKDGALLSAILYMFGVEPVRGSSSRRGPQALRELISWARRGYDLGITPDGPRGPACVVQEGVIALAQLTGNPIVPLSWCFSRKRVLKSWDRFQIPLPFSRCVIRFGNPVKVPRDASAELREQLRQRIEDELNTLSDDQTISGLNS